MRRLSTLLAKWMPRDATRRRSAAVWLSINRPIAGRARRGNPRQSPSRVREFAPLFEATSSFFPRVTRRRLLSALFLSHSTRADEMLGRDKRGERITGTKTLPYIAKYRVSCQAPRCKLLSPEIFFSTETWNLFSILSTSRGCFYR